MGGIVDKKIEEKDYMINISFTLFGKFQGEKLPRNLLIQRKIMDAAEDDGKFVVEHFKFMQDKLENMCPYKQNNDEDED